MILRLLVLALLLVLAWIVTRLLGGLARAATRGARVGRERAPEAPGPSHRLVRDRVCNTYLPAGQALCDRVGGEEHFFCSERCRRRFHEAVSAPPAGA